MSNPTMGKPKKPSILDRAFDERGVSRRTHHILLVMSKKACGTGVCFMSIDRIAKETGWARKTVSRAILELEALGRLVEVEGQPGRSTRTFRVFPGGRFGLSDASKTTISTGQIDPQNPKLNQNENPRARSQQSGTSKRRGRTASIGKLAAEQVRNGFGK